ncbi:MAG: RNA polymerase sigma factor RpoD/SigA [Candidatus Eremiobacteraeota bacterium]|nr:RNA polymerase sigma factor RpoD/SigA [Candidatus Eremiobacteraeota bacterium]
MQVFALETVQEKDFDIPLLYAPKAKPDLLRSAPAEVQAPPPLQKKGKGFTGEVNTLTSYLKDVYQHNLLTKEREEMLARRIAEGDERAKEAMVQSNLRLVINIAKKYINSGMSFQDLIQEGNIGLMEAAEKFDYRKGCRFATYATWWIRQSILRAIANQSRLIRLPVHILEIYRKYQKIVNESIKERGEAPTIEEVSLVLFPVFPENIRKKLSRSLGTCLPLNDRRVRAKVKEHEKESCQKLMEIISIAHEPISLEAPVGDEETCIGDLLPAQACKAPEFTNREVGEIFSKISSRERKILALRYGFADGVARTLQEISQEFGISKERVRQKEDDAIKKLRKLLERKDWM